MPVIRPYELPGNVEVVSSEGGITAYVGGVTAANVDLASKISSKLAELTLVVLALSIVLLLIAFRSLLIPVQAAVTNLLCVGAAFGVLVAAFQWGWGLDLVGLTQAGMSLEEIFLHLTTTEAVHGDVPPAAEMTA